MNRETSMQGSADYRFVTVRGFLAMLCLLAVEVQAQQVITSPSDIPTPSLAIEIPDPTQDSSENIPPSATIRSGIE